MIKERFGPARSLCVIAIVSLFLLAPSSLHHSLTLFFPLFPSTLSSHPRCDNRRLLDVSSLSICPFVFFECSVLGVFGALDLPLLGGFLARRTRGTSAATTRLTLRPKIEIIMIESICSARGGTRMTPLAKCRRKKRKKEKNSSRARRI